MNRRKAKEKTAPRKELAITAGFLAVGALLAGLARLNAGFGQWYSTHIYPVLVNVLGRITGMLPWSVAEILLYILLLLVLVTGIRLVVRRGGGKRWLVHILLAGSVLFFLYMAGCGVNYYRESFAESAGIRRDRYTVEELQEVCLWLTEEVNTWSGQVSRGRDGQMELKGSPEKEAVEAMESLGEVYPQLEGYYPRPKGLLNPWILSVQKLTGVYSPFTIEANYNTAMTPYNIPFTACHELSHLRGFMQEEEANFIAFLACRRSEDVDFQYSGAMLGWINCMNVLYEADYESWEEIRGQLTDGAQVDLAANSQFWSRYDGRVAEVADQVNDRYLKANGQKDGVESYDRMADLIVAWYLEQR
ncbi:DUF3810 domain-containing protein [Massilistercora timonensis]|uniref:DUF3810 domain-containing protein n=1 Tax=Massilistercora timonensis TaxID=2086584 RepID=UPI00320A6AA0